MPQLFSNNARSALASSITDVATSLTVTTGHGSKFPSPSGSDYSLLTLVGFDANGNENAWEIVKCTGRASDVLTIVRAQESTSAAAWGAGATVESRVTKGTIERFQTIVNDQNSAARWAGSAGGTADALTLTLDPPLTAYAAGQEFVFVASDDNTGSATVAINGLAAQLLICRGSVLQVGDIQSIRPYRIVYNGTQFELAPAFRLRKSDIGLGSVPNYNTREKLTAARTYYVRSDGSDSNDGLSNTAGGAFLTVQKAVTVVSGLDNGGYDVTIQLADATYAESVALKTLVGSGSAIIQGNAATPANVVCKDFSGTYIVGNWTIKDLVLTNGSAATRLAASGRGCVISFSGVTFGGTTTAYHIAATDGAVAKAIGNYSISAGSTIHAYAANTGSVEIRSKTVTITGTPAFSTAFAYCQILGQQLLDGNTFSGSATGPRYSAISNGVLYTAGGGSTYLPGNSAGSTATGGQYV